jgi:DNA-binding XRE family transcriptional regulator
MLSRKKRGPAPTGKGTLIGVRLQPPTLARLDDWVAMQEDRPSRPEAIRRLTTAMLQILDKDPGEKRYSPQIRAARALLGWSQAKLARGAGIGLETLQRIEQNEGEVKENFSTVLKIQKVFEEAGIHFANDETGEIGIRLRTRRPATPSKKNG